MPPIVSLPMTVLGLMISTLGSFAVRANRASAEMPRPGAITPPRYSADLVTAQNVVAVPKSTIMTSSDSAHKPRRR